MNKTLSLLLTSVLLLGCSTGNKANQQTVDADKQYVIILSTDAFRYDLASRSETPTLDSLMEVGTYSEIYPVFPSNTFPSHYAMATGLYPEHHGIVNNAFYDKTLGRIVKPLGNHDDLVNPKFWHGDPIWNTAERQGKTAYTFMWVGSETPIGGKQATKWMPYTSKPSFETRADWVIDAMTQPVNKIPDLVMWYFNEPDHTMHQYGPESQEAVDMAEKIDRALAYFFKNIRKSPVFDQINFIVLADHGMATLDESRRVNISGKLDENKVVREIYGNPAGIEVDPDYVDEAVEILDNVPHLTAWNRDRIPEKYHYGADKDRIPNIVLMPDTGWSLDFHANTRPLRNKGTHGFNPFDQEMHMIFYGAGPMFKKGFTQASFQNQNVYLVLCHLLGIEPSPNDCDWDAIKDMFIK